MTTIAWDGHTLAVDRGSWSGYVVHETTKLYPPGGPLEDKGNGTMALPTHYRNGWPMGAFAFTGTAGICMRILTWAQSGNDRPFLPESEWGNSHGVLVTLDRKVYRISGYLALEPVESVPFSDGGGQECAIGAMLAGASAKRAVEITAERTYLSVFGVDTWSPPA